MNQSRRIFSIENIKSTQIHRERSAGRADQNWFFLIVRRIGGRKSHPELHRVRGECFQRLPQSRHDDNRRGQSAPPNFSRSPLIWAEIQAAFSPSAKSSPPMPQGIDDDLKCRRLLAAAGIIEVKARYRRAPVFQQRDELALCRLRRWPLPRGRRQCQSP